MDSYGGFKELRVQYSNILVGKSLWSLSVSKGNLISLIDYSVLLVG